MRPPERRPVRFISREEAPAEISTEKPVAVLDWVATIIVLGIPFLNMILYLYWAFGDTAAPSKRNYCRACILLFVTGLVVSAVVWGMAAAVIGIHNNAKPA